MRRWIRTWITGGYASCSWAFSALNVVSVMGLSIFIYATIENIRRSYVAREFLSGVQAIVWYPYRNIWLCALLLALLAGSMFVRDRLFPDNSKVILFSLVADFAICFAIIILLNLITTEFCCWCFPMSFSMPRTGNPGISGGSGNRQFYTG